MLKEGAPTSGVQKKFRNKVALYKRDRNLRQRSTGVSVCFVGDAA